MAQSQDDIFAEVNRLSAAGMDEFRLESFDGSRLLVIGSADLCYYRDAEITFVDVAFIRCPTSFREARFREAGRTQDGTRFEVRTAGGMFEIVAASASATLGKVYHYDRGSQLQPGERVAPWVKRGSC